ncbi:MAG TPA: hypothetical protein VG672_14630 [Bryobacteraceae bacterium]|nr:hypothetical protein [Bryobacteraceae bacterium]
MRSYLMVVVRKEARKPIQLPEDFSPWDGRSQAQIVLVVQGNGLCITCHIEGPHESVHRIAL